MNSLRSSDLLPSLPRPSNTTVFALQSGTFFTTVRPTALVFTTVRRTGVKMTGGNVTPVEMTVVKNVPDWKVAESDVKVVDPK
jgi:hypothetical protein